MKRLVTALGLIALALYLIWWAPHAVFVAAAVCMGALCYYEYGAIVKGHAIRRPGVPGAVAGILFLFWPEYTLVGTTLLMFFSFAAALRLADLREVLPFVACSFAGAFYTFAPWRFAIVLRRESVHLLFFALALNWVGDSAAYYAGRAFGKYKLAPRVSPGKTWEGAVASIVASVVFGLIYLGKVTPQFALWKVAVMAVAGNIAGQFGDLAESTMKRGAGLKDSGHILPGHGGILDRVDSSLFALPVVFIIELITRNIGR